MLLASRYLSAYYALPEDEMPQSAACGYETIPTVVAMSDVFVTGKGYMFNTKASYTSRVIYIAIRQNRRKMRTG